MEKLCLAAGKEITKTGGLLHISSPSALGKLSVNELKNCSLGYRAAYIHATARMIAREKISFTKMETLSDKELTEKLLLFPGAGIKVVNCISLFAYHRTAAAPVDVWIGRVIQKYYGGVSPFLLWPCSRHFSAVYVLLRAGKEIKIERETHRHSRWFFLCGPRAYLTSGASTRLRPVHLHPTSCYP
ncbi:MAG: hypothetical protein ACLUIQ_08585 [Dialister invisus]